MGAELTTQDGTALHDAEVNGAKASVRPRRAAAKRKLVDVTEFEGDGDDEASAPVKKRTRKQTTTTKRKKGDATVTTESTDVTVNKSKASKKASDKVVAAVEEEDYVETNETQSKSTKRARGKKTASTTGEEKRLKRFRDKAPVSFRELFERATTQRMFVLERTQTASSNAPPVIDFDTDVTSLATAPVEAPTAKVVLAGSTGNIYQVKIDKLSTCTCPAYLKQHSPCKHIVYVLHHVLKAPENLVYQLAFVTSELVEIFNHAPPPPSASPDAVSNNGKRKPIEDDCPICCCEFEPEKHEDIVYCRAACGNNIHKDCFDQWAASKRVSGAAVTCPFCRTPWQASDPSELAKFAKAGASGAKVNEEGYVNIAQELGLSGKRDVSTYHGFWVRQQIKCGHLHSGNAENTEMHEVYEGYHDYD